MIKVFNSDETYILNLFGIYELQIPIRNSTN